MQTTTDKRAYLKATSLVHCIDQMPDLLEVWDITKLPTANVLAVLPDGNFLLATVKPPVRESACYMYSRGDVVAVDVTHIYYIIQEEALAWCEL